MDLRRVIIALVFLGFLCWAAWYFLAGGWDYGRYGRSERDLISLARSVHEFRHRNGRLPTTSEGVTSFAPAGRIYDPWGSEYKFRCPPKSAGKEYDLYSVGPDRVEGTSDDIEYKSK